MENPRTPNSAAADRGSSMFAIPLTAEQESMLFLNGIFGPGIFHNISFGLPVPDSVDDDAVAAAAGRLVARHDSLRTSLIGTSTLVQGLHSEIPVLHRTPAAPQDTAAAVIRRRNTLRDVKTSTGPVHLELVGESGGASRQLLGMVDHFASDGYSTRILHADLEALLRGREPAPVASFWELQRARRGKSGGVEREIAHWTEALSGITGLNGFMPRALDRSDYICSQVDRDIPGEGPDRAVRHLVEVCGGTPFTVIAVLLAVALWRRTGRRDVLLNTPVSTRKDAADWKTVGNFALDRPIPCRIDPDQPVAALVRRVQVDTLQAMRRCRVSVPELACEVPEYAASLLAPGADYLQLHVDVDVDPDVSPSSAYSTEPVRLCPFRPAHDLTVTTLRFEISRAGLATRTFFGGPPDGLAHAAELLTDVLALLETVGDGSDTTGALADTLDVPGNRAGRPPVSLEADGH
ncbi:condensation domain-containing protein [Streptomyces puniciscabiei]|uniref:condensation domain-containing protein n=1 Tax=Streptomyces puniciscabiei TaxID=164348 RepID=UPI001F2DF860|nr:condensation domain-containing protein [Streptomyces puniciscabiei]